MTHPLASHRLPSSTSATTTDLPSTDTQTRTPEARRMITVESDRALVMGGTVRPLAKAGDPVAAFSAAAFIPTTPDQAMALRFLRAQPVPLKPKRIIRQTSWSLARARRWLQFFAAKGLLLPTPAGHVWRTP